MRNTNVSCILRRHRNKTDYADPCWSKTILRISTVPQPPAARSIPPCQLVHHDEIFAKSPVQQAKTVHAGAQGRAGPRMYPLTKSSSIDLSEIKVKGDG